MLHCFREIVSVLLHLVSKQYNVHFSHLHYKKVMVFVNEQGLV